MVRTISAAKLTRRSVRTASKTKQGQDIPQQQGTGFQGTGAGARRGPCRSYLLTGAVIVIGAYALKMFPRSLHPHRVRVTKAGIAFKDWFRSNFGVAKEDFQDVVAEARQAYEKEKEGTVIHFNKELEMGEKLDSYIGRLEKELEEKKRSAVSKRNTKKRRPAR